MPRLRVSRRIAALAIAAFALAGLSLASASQLSLDGGTLQAGVAEVGDCQGAAPIAVGFATTFSGGAYRATAVTFSDVDASCDGLNYQVQLVDTGGNPIGSGHNGSIALAGGEFTVTLPSSVPAASIRTVALAITD